MVSSRVFFGSLESEKIIIGSLQIQTGFLTLSLKKPGLKVSGETSTLGQGGQIAVVGAVLKP